MNILLQFKQKSHSEAYSHDLQFQITKRLMMIIIWAVLSIVAKIASYAIIKNLNMHASEIVRMVITLGLLVGLCVLRCNLQRAKKHLNKINIVLDLCLIYVQFVFIPYIGGAVLNYYGKLGVWTLSWVLCIACFSTYFAIAHWWLKIIFPILQVVYFLVPTVQEERFWPIILILCVECVVVYGSFVYINELYKKKDFLEKRKVYENYEAILRIFDDINQGVMIVDANYSLIYSNRTVELMFNQSQRNLSLENLFSQIQVKSMSPGLELHLTERVQTNCDDDSEYQHTLKDYMEIISKALFVPNESESSITAETSWRDLADTSHSQKKNFSIKFTTSLFMNKKVIVVNVTDTTDRDSLIAAQASSEYKSRLLSSVSHELRTPLNGSINFIEESLSDTTIPTTTKEKWLVPALRSNRLLLSLVNDILDFSQMHAGKLRLVFEPRNIIETAKECIELVELQAAKKNLKLHFQNNLPPELEMIVTDHNRLRQVMLNLLSNAVKFTFKGEVSLILDPISIQFLQHDQIESMCTLKGVRVTCRDTGIGISLEDQKKLFQAFEKIDLGSRAVMNATGAGLGLLISNNLIQRLSPEGLIVKESKIIRFESKIGVGSTFYFDIYAHDEQRSSAHFVNLEKSSAGESEVFSEKGLELRYIEELIRPLSFSTNYRCSSQTLIAKETKSQGVLQTAHTLGSLTSVASNYQISCKCPKVLIVDDDPFNLTALEQILSRLKIPCHSAFHGKEAIEKIESRQHNRCSLACQQYKIVFLDCNMPIMDGFETSRILRGMIKRGEIDDFKIIACTAFVQQSDEDNAKEAGMDDFCTKPIKVEGIKEKLRAVGFF